jgi:hypothetical protein
VVNLIYKKWFLPLVTLVIPLAALGFFLAVWLAVGGLTPRELEKLVETVTYPLPSGEIITDESFVSANPDGPKRDRIYFQQEAATARELLGETLDQFDPFSLKSTSPKILRSGGRVAVLIGSNLFLRWPRAKGPYWCHTTSQPDPTASVFLRSFLPPGDSRIPAPPGDEPRTWFHVERPKEDFVFQSIDLDQNTLVTRRASNDPAFPEFLIYKAPEFGWPWSFDLDGTRNANHLTPPTNSDLQIDFSAIVFFGDSLLGKTREALLALPKAKEIHSQSSRLHFGSWTTAKWAFSLPDGHQVDDQFEVRAGFLDPLPDYLSVFWRDHHLPGENWHFGKSGEWVEFSRGGYKGGLSRVAYFRVRRGP